MDWIFATRGGPYGGCVWPASLGRKQEPPPVVGIVDCGGFGCPGHLAIDLSKVETRYLKRMLVYKRDEVQQDEHSAIYVLGDLEPDGGVQEEQERELVPAGGIPDEVPDWMVEDG